MSISDAKFEIGTLVEYDGNTAEIKGLRFALQDLGEGWEYYISQTAPMPEGEITRYLWASESQIIPLEDNDDRS